MKKSIVIDVLCNLFVLLFLYTGLIKILDRHVFYMALDKSPLLHPYATFLSFLVPWTELLIAIGMLVSATRRKALYIFMIMMGIFTIYIGFMLYFSTERPCTCGGIIEYMNWHQHFYFNSLFTLLAGIIIWLDKQVDASMEQKFGKMKYNH